MTFTTPAPATDRDTVTVPSRTDHELRAAPEWPPHPAQVFCRLTRAALDEHDRTALRWLEQQPAPRIHITQQTCTQPTPGQRTADHPRPGHPTTTLCWQHPAPTEIRHRLDAMARRALTGASLHLRFERPAPTPTCHNAPIHHTGHDTTPTHGVTVDPCSLIDADVSLGTPFPGFLDQLSLDQFSTAPDDDQSWHASRFTGYRFQQEPRRRTSFPQQLSTPRRPSPPSVYTDVVVFTLQGRRIPGWHAPQLTEALRRAVLAVAGDRAPEALHGHRADGLPHVAFLALPDVGEPSSDGSIMGMAVAVPELPETPRTQIVRAVQDLRRRSGTDTVTLRGQGFPTAVLHYSPGHVRPWAASPERWRQGSRRWTTATPMVLDHYPKRPAQTEQRIRESVHRLGLPDPLTVRFDTDSLLKGGIALRPHDLPEQNRRKLYYHVELTFPDPVAGPLLIGAGRYLGVGLFAPHTAATVIRRDARSGDLP
jgi:CRISPR-associated protein Csb2